MELRNADHFKSQQRCTELSWKSPSSETISRRSLCQICSMLPRYSFISLPCDEQLLVSLSHTTKPQHALSTL